MNIIKTLSATVAFGGLMLATGCASTQIYDPTVEQTNIRSSYTISHEELRQVARDAANQVLIAPRFVEYVEKFRAENGRRPVLKLTSTRNDTNDPNLNVAVINETLQEVFFNSNLIDVTLAEGTGRAQSIADSRMTVLDDNFDKNTVAKQGRLLAANIVLRPTVVSNEVRDGRSKAVERYFVIDIADIDRGTAVFKYSKPLGFVKTRGAVGW